MKINKSLKGLFLGLTVSGILLAGGMSAYSPAHCFADDGQSSNSSTLSAEELDEKIKKVVDEKFKTSVDEKIKTAVNNKVENIANERFKGIVEDELNNKADWYVLYFSALALVLGLCGTGLAVFSMDKASDAKKQNEDIKNGCNCLQQQIDDLRNQIDASHNNNAAWSQVLEVLNSRPGKIREAENRYEINNHAPISSDNGFSGRMRKPGSTIGMKEEQKTSKDDLLRKEYEGIKSEYSSLMDSWCSGDKGSYRTKRKAFQDKYGVVEFSCINAGKRMTSNEPPVFKTVDITIKGDFWAIASKIAKGIFFVYPSASLTYENQVHSTGGMKEAFDSNYRSGAQQNMYFSVDAPAYFTQAGDEWCMGKKGKLTFK